jgi:aryl-alcohol dehydrogenase-like predicted oxidoreductase
MKTSVHASVGGTIRIGDMVVNRLGYGAMRLLGPGAWGEAHDRKHTAKLLRRALEFGVALIDTSDAYGPHINEEQIAEALYPYPEGVVIATKGGLKRPAPGAWEPDCRPERLRECCEGSLERLKLERIDLYQLHAVDPKVPYLEQIGALAELQREGKIRHIGLSNVHTEQLKAARSITEIVSVQNRYNVAYRESEPVLELCEREGLAFLPWFPLNAGEADRYAVLREIARTKHCSTSQLALAWLLQRSPSMVPIPGTASLEHLEQNIAASKLVLTDEELERMNFAAHPHL